MRDPKTLELKSKLVAGDNLNYSQKWAKAIRPQKPSDNTQGGEHWSPGQLPKGGFRSVFCFEDGNYSTKLSPTTKPEKNRII